MSLSRKNNQLYLTFCSLPFIVTHSAVIRKQRSNFDDGISAKFKARLQVNVFASMFMYLLQRCSSFLAILRQVCCYVHLLLCLALLLIVVVEVVATFLGKR